MTGTAPTNMTPDWIQRVIAMNPCADIGDGNVRTEPVRLGFPHLEKPQKAMEDDKADKYAATALFQMPNSDILPVKLAAAGAAQDKWGDRFQEFSRGANFHVPWKDQADKASQYEGFVAGRPYFTATGERRPSLVMQNMAPYTGRIYPGMWAFLIVRPFAFNTMNKQGVVVKRGIGIGLQSVMIICDDVEFGGGSVDPRSAFAGVNIEAGVNPAAAFGAAQSEAALAADIFR